MPVDIDGISDTAIIRGQTAVWKRIVLTKQGALSGMGQKGNNVILRPIEGPQDVQRIAGSYDSAWAVTRKGELWKIALSSAEKEAPAAIPKLTNVIDVCACNHLVAAQCSDGAVWVRSAFQPALQAELKKVTANSLLPEKLS